MNFFQQISKLLNLENQTNENKLENTPPHHKVMMII